MDPRVPSSATTGHRWHPSAADVDESNLGRSTSPSSHEVVIQGSEGIRPSWSAVPELWTLWWLVSWLIKIGWPQYRRLYTKYYCLLQKGELTSWLIILISIHTNHIRVSISVCFSRMRIWHVLVCFVFFRIDRCLVTCLLHGRLHSAVYDKQHFFNPGATTGGWRYIHACVPRVDKQI